MLISVFEQVFFRFQSPTSKTECLKFNRQKLSARLLFFSVRRSRPPAPPTSLHRLRLPPTTVDLQSARKII